MSDKNDEIMDKLDGKSKKKEEDAKTEVKSEKASSSTIKKSESKELVKKELNKTDLKILDYKDFSTPAKMLELGEVLVKSGLVPLKTKEDVMTALMKGNELGLPFISSLSNIYPINGRPTLGVHIQRAILINKGIIIKKTEDAEPIYEFAKADKEGNAIKIPKKVKTDKGIVEKQVSVIVSTGTIKEQPESTLKRRIDYRTSYFFERELRQPNGTYKTMTATSSFTMSEAMQAELTDKDVWIKYWKRMLDARAFAIGAKEIADDLLQGIYSPSELSSNYYVNDEGEEVHIAEVQ